MTTTDPDAPAPDKPKRAPKYNVFERVELFAIGEQITIKGARESEDDKFGRIFEPQPHTEARNAVRPVKIKAAGAPVMAWVLIAPEVSAPTGQHAIDLVTGTAENPVDGFDADRRLHPFCPVLVDKWEPRQRVRTVTEAWS
jgi:hypothetical protein